MRLYEAVVHVLSTLPSRVRNADFTCQNTSTSRGLPKLIKTDTSNADLCIFDKVYVHMLHVIQVPQHVHMTARIAI